jgi:DNA polymerase III subunit tau-like protein
VLLSDLASRLEALGGGSGAGNPGGHGNQTRSGRASGPSGSEPPAKSSARSAHPAASTAAPVSYDPPAETGLASSAEPVAGEDSVSGWTKLINLMMGSYPRIGSCLMKGLPELDEAKGVLKVTFAEDTKFALNNIQNESARIEELAAKNWGRELKVVLTLGGSGQSDAGHEEIRQQVAPTHSEELDKACAKDKQLGDLVDIMGGQPLPDSDRERWDPPGK